MPQPVVHCWHGVVVGQRVTVVVTTGTDEQPHDWVTAAIREIETSQQSAETGRSQCQHLPSQMQKILVSQGRSHPLVAHCVWVPVKVQDGARVGERAVVIVVVVMTALQGPADTVLSKKVSIVWSNSQGIRERNTSQSLGERQSGSS